MEPRRNRGEVINDSFSTRPARVSLQFLRYCRYEFAVRLLRNAFLFFSIFAVALFIFGHWIIGSIVALPVIALILVLFWVRKMVAGIYKHAALTTGIVISESPLEFVSLANMDNGAGHTSWAVKRISIDALPCHATTVGTRFPCVAGFQDGPRTDRWGNFNPNPLSFGTGDAKLLETRLADLGVKEFEILEGFIRSGRVPKKANEILFIEEETNTPPPIFGAPPRIN